MALRMRVAPSACSVRSEKKHVVMDVESRQVLADHHHHRGDGAFLDKRHPLVFRHDAQARAVLSDQRLAYRHKVIAGIEPRRDLADLFAQRFAVAQEGRAGERIDLRAGVVDVIFLGDLVACKFKQVGERVADDGATAMSDMHRTGRIGRDIFDIDLAAGTHGALAVFGAFGNHDG